MKTLFLNAQGDLEFDGQNSLRMVEGPDEKQQSVRLLLQTNTGEWFLNLLHGLAYDQLQVKNPNETAIRAAFLEAFQQESRIQEVISLEISFDRSARHLTVNFKVRMDEEDIVEGEEVL